jgi:hypothetical protein
MTDTTQIADPKTPAELMALDPGERLQFFLGLQATSPEIAALVIRTVLEDVRPGVATTYYNTLKYLVDSVDPMQVYRLSIRYVDTVRAGERLAIHQFVKNQLAQLLHNTAWACVYVRRDSQTKLWIFGTLSDPVVVRCKERLNEGDMVVYDHNKKRPAHRARNGCWPEVDATRVELEDQSLPSTFGLDL